MLVQSVANALNAVLLSAPSAGGQAGDALAKVRRPMSYQMLLLLLLLHCIALSLFYVPLVLFVFLLCLLLSTSVCVMPSIL